MKAKLESLARQYGLADVYVFGSRASEIAARARDEQVPASRSDADVDIGVRPLPGQPLSARDRATLTVELEDLLAVRRVDLVVLPEADPFLALDAIRGELLFCADPDAQAEHELYVLRRAGDLAPFARERWEQVLKGGHMTPSPLRAKVVAEQVAWIRRVLEALQALPLGSFEEFMADRRNVAAAESHLRRALEALLDLGRHLLAKGFGRAAVEYRDVATGLADVGVVGKDEAALLRTLAGYRNRLVHFYHEVGDRELYEICSRQLGDIETALASILRWIEAHPEKIDRAL